jgi:hypothetical protein
MAEIPRERGLFKKATTETRSFVHGEHGDMVDKH